VNKFSEYIAMLEFNQNILVSELDTNFGEGGYGEQLSRSSTCMFVLNSAHRAKRRSIALQYFMPNQTQLLSNRPLNPHGC